MSLYFCCTCKPEPEDVQLEAYNRSTTPGYTEKETFFVITPIFNPASYQKRYGLYHQFAQHMKNTGAQLITIECIFPSLNQHHFQVTNPDNPFHIQLRSESIYWMKENLINIAVSRLPAHAKWVCWLDADIHFDDKNWIDQTLFALKKYTVVQVFKKAKFLGPQNQIIRIDHSFGYSAVHNKPIDQNRYQEWYPHPGYGWAMSVSTFRLINGLPDYDIVGSGDLHFAFSLLNRVSNAIESDLNTEFKSMIIQHSQEIFYKLGRVSKSESKAIVGYVPLTINHYWHGSRKDRQYMDRWKILIAHNFNYLTDVVRNTDGLLVLINNKPQSYFGSYSNGHVTSSLQEDIQLHFEKRNEDATEYKVRDNLLAAPRPPPPKKIKKRPQPKKQHKTFTPTKMKHSSTQQNHFMDSAGVQAYGFQGHGGHYGNNYHGGITTTTQY